MCGFVGVWEPSRPAKAVSQQDVVRYMSEQLTHRGPDDSGIWSDIPQGICLGHRRLSIIDVSGAGHQPMTSHSGRWVIVFNGEIYNFKRIRKILSDSGAFWNSVSDTEVMLHAIEAWGLDNALSQFEGMFAFALWDKLNREIYLGRDRLGEKPLYYSLAGKSLIFGSELKSLMVHPHVSRTLDVSSLRTYLDYGYIPAPNSIYEGISKVEPGTYIRFGEASVTGSSTPQLNHYWNLKEKSRLSQKVTTSLSLDTATDQLDTLLKHTVSDQMVADVPVGCFLSGGIDSSLVCSYMQLLKGSPVNTFTIGFADSEYDESSYAKEISTYLGTNHNEYILTASEAIESISKLHHIYDEPFADSSQVPTLFLASHAHQFVKVALSGDGGDESFAGYNRYRWASDLSNTLTWLPYKYRSRLASVLTRMPYKQARYLTKLFALILPAHINYENMTDKLLKLASIIDSRSHGEIYRKLTTNFSASHDILGEQIQQQIRKMPFYELADLDFVHQMMLTDSLTYLPDDILVKVDRASMANSLEVRSPFLNHNVIEYAWRLPLNYKLVDGNSKFILKKILSRYIPESLFNRSKMGFGFPLGQWLCGPLKPWADELLDPELIQSHGYLSPKGVSTLWNEHQSGKRNWQYQLWTILILQSWLVNTAP